MARYVKKILPEKVPQKLTPVRLAEENNKVSENVSAGTEENRRQAESGDDAGASGFCLGTG